MDHDHAMMGEALAEARLALDEGILPVGAVLTLGAAIIGRGRKFMDFNHLDHAEMIAFRRAFTGNYPFRRGDPITLYTTLEPCVMCWGTLRHLPVRPLVYAMPDAYGGCAAADLVPSPPATARDLWTSSPACGSRKRARFSVSSSKRRRSPSG